MTHADALRNLVVTAVFRVALHANAFCVGSNTKQHFASDPNLLVFSFTAHPGLGSACVYLPLLL